MLKILKLAFYFLNYNKFLYFKKFLYFFMIKFGLNENLSIKMLTNIYIVS